MRDASLLQDKVIELNDAILSAQSSALDAQAEQLALAERVRDLEKELARHEKWDAETKRYILHDFGSGTFAYILKEGMESGEPPHRICAACYQKGHKSILQFRLKISSGQDRYACPACKTEFDLGHYIDPGFNQTSGLDPESTY